MWGRYFVQCDNVSELCLVSVRNLGRPKFQGGTVVENEGEFDITTFETFLFTLSTRGAGKARDSKRIAPLHFTQTRPALPAVPR